MDLSEKDKLEMDKSDVDHANYQTSNISSEWRFGGANLPTPHISLVPANNSISNLSTGSSVSMGDSLCPGIWDHRALQNTGFSENNHIQTSTSVNNVISGRKLVPDASWNSLALASNRSVYLQSGAAVLPQSLSQFPADSAFIERAAGFSCFNGGNFSDMVMYPVGASESMGPYSQGGGIQVAEVASDNGLKIASGLQSQKKGLNVAEVDTEILPAVNLGGTKVGPMISEREDGSNSRPYDEGKCGIRASISESDEAEFSGTLRDEPLTLDNAVGETSTKEVSAKKRKRNSEDVESDEVIGALQLSVQTSKDSVEAKLQEEQNPNSAASKPAGKHVKDSSQNLDVPKEEYIHVRARRGQATNSHSLAERVRREKISERMKFLQDLVPGCSKVTGKAVMLDEIINYVQSLQRQVEFLSMKLAAVNPRLDFNIEDLLSKNILQARGGMPSTIGFTPDMGMSHLQLRPSHQGLIHPGIPGIGNPSEMLRRTLNSQFTPMNGFKEPPSQMANIWDEELHNVMQMSFGMNVPSNSQELNGSHQSGHMKSEL